MKIQTIEVTVIPRSSHNQIVEQTADYIKIKLTATPTDGQANKALIKFLAKKFGVPQSHIEITHGLASKKKLVRIYK